MEERWSESGSADQTEGIAFASRNLATLRSRRFFASGSGFNGKYDVPLQHAVRHLNRMFKDKHCLPIKLPRSKTVLPQQDRPSKRPWMH